MGKGHKDRRREQRAREMEERAKDLQVLKEELQREQEEKFENYQALKKKNEEEVLEKEKVVETSSDTDSGRGSSTALSTESPKQTVERKKHRSLIKGLHNIGNTCFFNVIIQSLAHTPLLVDQLYEEKLEWIEQHNTQYFSTMTSQLLKILDEFTSNERKTSNIDPKPLFNSLIQRIPCYKDYNQHDSHELFMNLMLILRAEEVQLRRLKPRSVVHSDDDNDPSKMFCLIGCNEPYTYYDSIFGGHFLDVLTCKKCQKSLMKIEPFLGILLPLTDRASGTKDYRTRQKRDDYTGNRTKKEPKILSRKQQKALKKQERKNVKRSTAGSRLKGRNSAKKKSFEEPMPLPTEENESKPEETSQVTESTDAQPETPVEVEEKTEKEADENEELEEKPEEEDGNDESDADDDEPKGPLTTTESTCILADMVSKLTLIHETSCRPLPFVDETIAQQFLTCDQTTTSSTSTVDETDETKTLENCFQRFFRCETLTGENAFDCYYCRSLEQGQKRVLTDATRQTVFFQLPPILPVFLKRFQMNGTRSEKINRFIQFPLDLNLTSRCSSQVKLNAFNYSLYAVIEHTGTLRSGHYVAYIKQSFTDEDLSNESFSKPIDDLLKTIFHPATGDTNSSDRTKTSQKLDPSIPPPAWYYISDNSIHKVPESKVLEADAYVLFYRRI